MARDWDKTQDETLRNTKYPSTPPMQQQYPQDIACEAAKEMTIIEKLRDIYARINVLDKQVNDNSIQLARRLERIEQVLGVNVKD